jgi:LPS-assembly protein
VTYGNYDPQPDLGFLTQREGISTTGRLKLTQNWNLLGSALYDLDQQKIVATNLGVGFINDCLIVALNYIRGYSYTAGLQDTQTVMLQVQFRTLGGLGTSQVIAKANPTQ